MEFYLWLVKKFVKAGNSIFLMWEGGKLTCAAMVRFESARLELILIPPFFVLISLTPSCNLILCVIRSTRSDARYSPELISTPMLCMQMTCRNVSVLGREAEAGHWEDIAKKALTLDADDFLSTGYRVNAKLKNPVNTPAHGRANTRPTDRYFDSPAKRRRTDTGTSVVDLSEKDTELTNTSDENDRNDLDFNPSSDTPDNKGMQNLDEDLPDLATFDTNATTPGPWSRGTSEFRRPSEAQIHAGTLGASSSGGRRTTRNEPDPKGSILDSLKDMIADNQRKTKMQMAKLHARQERNREDSLRMHEESCRMHEENSCLMQQ